MQVITSTIPMERCSYRFAQLSDLPVLCSVLSQESWRLLSRLREFSCTKPEWILLSFEAKALTDVLALASHSDVGIPHEIFRLNGEFNQRTSSLRLFQWAIEKAKFLGARELYYTIPEDSTETADISEARFVPWRKIVRFESPGLIDLMVRGYRSANVGSFERGEIIALIEKTSESSSDSQIVFYRQRLGGMADAEMTLQMMESFTYDPQWWRVALTPGGQAVGVILPVVAFGEPTIGFVGVLPEHRGRSIAPFLLVEAWSVMKRDGLSTLCADADQFSVSMHRALAKSGFVRRWQKQEWRLEL